MQLSSALNALVSYRQFVLWKRVLEKNKWTKKPLNIQGFNANAHDTKNHVDYETARKAVEKFDKNHGVGFVLTKNDPFFLLDFDNAWSEKDQSWSPIVLDLYNRLNGAASEVSSSGTGLHIIGTLTSFPLHACKNIPLNIELYTKTRLIALTDVSTTGDVNFNCDTQLQEIISLYFATTHASSKIELTDGPCEDWCGPTSDEELLRRAMQSKSARASFENHASFKDLWENNTEKFPESYIPETADAVFNASSVDIALAQHLAFWTGKDGTRIQRLMMQSQLIRDKWDRADYLPRTISRACALCTEVLKDKPLELAAHLTTAEPSPVPRLTAGTTFLTLQQQQEFFKGHTYVVDCHAVLAPPGRLYAPARYSAFFGGYTFMLDARNEKVTRDPFKVITESQCIQIPKVHTTCFRPELPPGEIVKFTNDTTAINTFYPQKVPRTFGDVSPFLNHLEKILPNERDREIMLAYMAACVQYQGVKFRWCVLTQGVDGNGKTLLGECVAEAIGNAYVSNPSGQELTNNFNSFMYNKLLVLVEDIYLAESPTAVAEALKPIIDRPRQNIRLMYHDAEAKDICCNFMLNANPKDAIRKTENDRRFCILQTAQQTVEDLNRDGMDEASGYFTKLVRWFKKGNGHAFVTDFLYTYKIPDEFNPATECHRAPITSTTQSAIEESRSHVEQEVVEAVEQQLIGFRGGWISSHYLNELLKQGFQSRKMSHTRRRDLLRHLGYVPHPALNDGRASTVVMPDGSRSRLFISVKHPDYKIKEQHMAMHSYRTAQDLV